MPTDAVRESASSPESDMIVVGKLNNFWREDLDARIAIKILGSAPHAKTAGLCALVGLPNWGVYTTCAVYWKEQGTCQVQRFGLIIYPYWGKTAMG